MVGTILMAYERTPEHRAKQSATLKECYKDPEYHKKLSKAMTKHGHRKPMSPTYISWLDMKQRCRDRSRKYYGAKGISVCERWESFESFLADMGERPDGMTLDRINNDGNYEPSNCRWATPAEQIKNRSMRPETPEIPACPTCGHTRAFCYCS